MFDNANEYFYDRRVRCAKAVGATSSGRSRVSSYKLVAVRQKAVYMHQQTQSAGSVICSRG